MNLNGAYCHEVELNEWNWYPWKYTSNPPSSKRIVVNSCCKWGHSYWLKGSSISSTTPHCSKSNTWSCQISSSLNRGGRSQFTSWFSWHPSLKIKGSPSSPSLLGMRDWSLRPHCWMHNSRLSSSCFNLSNLLRDMASRIFVGWVLCFGTRFVLERLGASPRRVAYALIPIDVFQLH